MNITEKQLKIQFDRALSLGWLPFFEEAVKSETNGVFDEGDLLGIASRETNLDPQWLKKPGDRGNGFGLMQADRRSFPEFTKSDKWKDARTGILFGAKVLMQKHSDTKNCIGKSVVVKSSKGGIYSFVGKSVTGRELQQVSISAYNCGRWAHYAVSTGRNADKYSTGGDYSEDVMERAAYFRVLFKEWKAKNTPKPIVDYSATNESAKIPQTEVKTTESDFLTNALDKTVSADEIRASVKAGLPTVGLRVWRYLARPFLWIYAALEAGNIAVWFGVLVVIGILIYILYRNRAKIFTFWEKLKTKLSS